MLKTAVSSDLRDQLAPHVRKAGISATARATGIQPSAVGNWLAGRRALPVRHIEALARACGVRIVVEVKPE